ncbi:MULTISPECIES: carbon starvation protein A [unclassified Exiguobacterium]|uniref:carbon starvation CstA family protein n=1 Tax=unclassified Exiguobacterium TaxID=2644629 RepID=UPI00103E9C3C|nr:MULTISPECIES: carbon starvation CstA family protein [unclassified Exiguobacterium]TCI48337.1 carbon starvation protein A [Exiguobacterium sp. SH5S32]TCI55225.1 carbon starvation protein A [Exiguobacterium sp. SH1S4]TCI75017.1 carbon starvation protein A [Exiguobacterium sp. SH1S1]TCI77948.1 carbon starvation protein A [Exiguobacterium sp. SH0S1]
MITFFIALGLLLVGYLVYGRYVEKTFGIKEERTTPAYASQDGVDYVPMGKKRNSMIQLLNIAGVGPIFGPIMGALYGPVAFLWIVVGSIFAGAVHDYLTGMISLRNNGAHLPQLAEKFLGRSLRHVVNGFALLLLLLVGTVFVTSPANMINNLFDGNASTLAWVLLAIFGYYILATLLPVDKIIGRIYPFFGALLLISAVGIAVSLFAQGYQVPEMTFTNMHPDGLPIWPLLFFTISCGALSGFHATQSPIISRTTMKESNGRSIFYGMMIVEAVIAMIWAAAAMAIFEPGQLLAMINAGTPALVVQEVATLMLGSIGGTLAILGVIVLPITSGDTAFRSARMIIADYMKIAQKKFASRLWIALPLFVISFILTKVDFRLLWQYFNWANQTTAVIALFVGATYLYIKGRNYWIALVPGTFMLYAVWFYILTAPIGFKMDGVIPYVIATVGTVTLFFLFFKHAKAMRAQDLECDAPVRKAA